MKIIDLPPGDEALITQAAALLVEGFRATNPEAWPTLEDGLEEVRENLDPERICRVAVDESGAALGWIGAQQATAVMWELHPLVVAPASQGRGVGRALVRDLERQVWARGGRTLWLGSDDEADLTSLGGVDVYPDPLAHLAALRNLRGHPFEFYQKQGFVLVGLLPDANGFGKPDILMAKRLAPPE
ncbi:MAG TPA: GNAT family N-acetyltransferase [Herpetosiphonaceae bacterium]